MGDEQKELQRVHLPAILTGEFGISTSEARRRISLGRVKINGEVVTELDVPLPDGDMQVEMESRPVSDAICGILSAEADLLHKKEQ